MTPDVQEQLRAAVQRNCDIADARHAGDLPLCSYLLHMREFCRWDLGRPLADSMDRQTVGNWIAAREAQWDALESLPYGDLPLGAGDTADPFAVERINRMLLPHGLLYGAGLVARSRPVFFLAVLHAQSWREGLELQQAGRESARGLLAPPAALAGEGRGPVVLRREALLRIGWERLETWRLRPGADTPLSAMARHYGWGESAQPDMRPWLDDQVEAAWRHEWGEHRVGQELGPAWSAMRQQLPSARADGLARAVRDLWADLSLTLPSLLDEDRRGALHAWFAGFDGLRLALYPDLPKRWAQWHRSGDAHTLRRAVDHGHAHFRALALQCRTSWDNDGAAALAGITECLGGPAAVCSFQR